MSARELPHVAASAFCLAALLEQYEQDVDQLTSTWCDADLYERVNQELGQMRLLCGGLPMLSVAWVHVLISHAELVHCLWRGMAGAKGSRPAEDCKADHLLAVRALRQKCLHHFSRIERS